MSVSDICKVFEKQQNMTSSTNSTSSSVNSQTNSPISPSERIKINKNLEMRKRELFGKEESTSGAETNNIEPKAKITKFTNNTVESLASPYKVKSTNNLIAHNSSGTSSTNSPKFTSNPTAQTPVKESSFINQTLSSNHLNSTTAFKEADAQTTTANSTFKTPIEPRTKSSDISMQSSTIVSKVVTAVTKDETDAVSSNLRSTSRPETIINASVNREIEPPKINRNTAKYTAEVLNELIEQASKSIEEELSSQNIKHTIEVIILQRESVHTGSIGIILAGGIDCENKEITVRYFYF